ncbi:MAG: hypothetical protein J6Z13_06995 [Clostridia bacterium]|nr:hypothetical protein [Clostridia bacterium]
MTDEDQAKENREDGVPPPEAGEKMIRYFRACAAGGELPTFSGAAELLGVDVATVGEWKTRDPIFARALAECRAILSDHLIRQGLLKRYDASLVKFLLPFYGTGSEDGEDRPDELSVVIEVLDGGSPGDAG